MMNPDGVFVGNYRTGVIGDDFNRKFSSGKSHTYPEIFALKNIVNEAKNEGNVELFIDLHGHSILKNSFFYGPGES
jgi:murein tripeptide amidase MpaA